MRLFSYLIILAFMFELHAQNWQQISDFPGTERDDGTSFLIGDTAYFGTGMTPWWSNEADFYGLNLTTEQWFSSASLPLDQGRQYASGFSVGGKGFVFGGYNGSTFLNDLWCFDPAQNSWTQRASLPSFGRSGCGSFLINDTVYIIGGKTSSSSAISEVWCYASASDSWIQKADLPFGKCWRPSATEVNDKGYLLFGRDENNFFLNSLLQYDPLIDNWTQISTFPASGRSHATMKAMNNSLYVCFGIDSLGNSLNDLWNYDLLQNSWNVFPGIPSVGRRGGMSIVSSEVFYYSTGIDEGNHRLKETWKHSNFLSIGESNIDKPELLRIVDLTGRETPLRKNTILIYIYSDGSVKKVFTAE